MINLTQEARIHLDKYLNEVRTSLAGCSVDVDDILGDINDHIESELHDLNEPASFDQLDEVLKRLGDPQQWVPPEEISSWRKMIQRLRKGPEDWRLAYLAFALLAVSIYINPERFFLWIRLLAFPLRAPLWLGEILLSYPSQTILLLASFILARAAIAASRNPHDLRGQKWLLYPPLIVTYILLLIFLLGFAPLAMLAFWAPKYIAELKELASGLHNSQSARAKATITSITIAATGLWWIILGVLSIPRPHYVRVVFRPFAEWFGRKHAAILICIGLLLLLISLLIINE